MDKTRSGTGKRGRWGRAQVGATAVEFALVFPVFFLLFYGLLTYGLIFFMRLGLQHAAEDGARAALRYPAQSCAQALGKAVCTAQEQRQHQFAARMGSAYVVAATQARWMNSWTAPTIAVRVCQTGVDCLLVSDVVNCAAANCTPPVPAALACGADFATSCQIVVTLSYDYGSSPVLPRLPGFGLVTPNNLIGQARLLLDGRALSS